MNSNQNSNATYFIFLGGAAGGPIGKETYENFDWDFVIWNITYVFFYLGSIVGNIAGEKMGQKIAKDTGIDTAAGKV